MKTKKLIYSGVVCIVLVATTALSAFAIKESIVKEKNAFQIASDKGIPISEVDKEQNFKYTTISTNAKNSNDSNIPDREDFSNDPKANIYNKMLNTIDFFNEIELTMETSMLGDGVTTVKYQTNIDTGCSYQSVTENGVIKTETYSESGKKELIHVDNLAKTYNQKFLATYERSDTPYVPLEKRIFAAEDGIPCYTYYNGPLVKTTLTEFIVNVWRIS